MVIETRGENNTLISDYLGFRAVRKADTGVPESGNHLEIWTHFFV